MVGMVVGDEERPDHVDADAYFCQFFLNGAERDARVYQYAVCVGAQEVTIAAASACQAYKS